MKSDIANDKTNGELLTAELLDKQRTQIKELIRVKKEQGAYFEEKKREMDQQDREDAAEQEKVI